MRHVISISPMALITVALCSHPAMHAQSAPPPVEFDAVSIKPNKTSAASAGFGGSGGRWTMANIPASGLILSAYPTLTFELLGAPAWVESERFDVDARAAFEPTAEQKRTMLRALLADRFKFAAHYETQERPIYNLVVARADGRPGRQLRHIDIDCATYKPQIPGGGAPAPSAADPPPCSFRMSGGSGMLIVSGGRTLQSLADSIAPLAGRPILDKTGLTGYYAFTLESGGFDGGLSIFTALEEQLGLKLEPTRGPVDVLFVDHIERPSEN